MLNFIISPDSSARLDSIGAFIYRRKFLFFILVFALQLGLNLYRIGENSLWHDESFTVSTANRTIAGIVEVSKTDVNPPLYPLIVHYWIKLFGISEFSVRGLSALAGALASAFLFLFCLRFINWQTAVFSAAMFFASYVFFYYSQEARTYSLVLLFVVFSNYLFFMLAEEKRRKKGIWLALLLGLVNIGLFYLHFLACFAIIAQVILCPLFILKKREEANGFKLQFNRHFIEYYALSWVAFILLLLPFYERFLFLVKEGGNKMWLQKPVPDDLKRCVYEMFNVREVYQAYIYLLIVICLLLLFRRLRNEGFKLKLLLFGLISGPGMFYLNYKVASYSPIFLLRYVLFTLLGFIVMYSYLLSELRIKFSVKLIVFLPVLVFAFIKIKMPKEVVQDYKNAVKYLKSVKNEHTLISTDLPDVFSYYYDKDIFNITDDTKKMEVLYNNGIYAQNYNLEWPDQLDFTNVKDIYYTQSFEYLNDGNKVVMKRLNARFDSIESISQFMRVNIVHYINRDYKSR